MRRLIRFLFGPSMAERQWRIREDRALIDAIDAIDAYLRDTEVPHG